MSRAIGSLPFAEEVAQNETYSYNQQGYSYNLIHAYLLSPRCFLMIRLMIFSGGQQYRPDT